ncbi:sigma-70 family RNA polymerase sigma factor [Actinospongicola halichondriae]|uniref:RNA polymerase sigma factor n=1 Tax=Actinospongicola halichondriae TaxID=3236844 RepID=UPI003D3E4795
MALRADDVDLGRDRDLVARYQNGDPEAFDDLYRCYFNRLRRYCQRHTNDRHEAEEVAQEAFVKALRSMDSLQGERRFYPWMTVIAKRIIIDRHRKMARIDLTEEPDLGSVEPDIDHLFAEVDAGHVREAMDNLGPRHREVLMLREAQSLSYADIAGTLDVPVTTVEALLHRARKALRREYAVVAGAEGRGIWGLPLLGWLGTRARGLRARVDERWAEMLAVGAPLAVGAITAAAVLLPSTPGEVSQIETAAAPSTTVAEAPASTTTVLPVPAPVTSLVVDEPATTVAPTSTAAPTVDAGPVDIYVGPEGTEVARQKAESMPVSGSLGPATGGINPPEIDDDLAEIAEGIFQLVFGRPSEPIEGTP